MVKQVRKPKVLDKWPSVVLDTGEDPLGEVKLRVFQGGGIGGVGRLPDYSAAALAPDLPSVDVEGGKCKTLRDVVVKHTLNLLDPKKKIPEGELLKKAEEVAVKTAFAYAFRSHLKSGSRDFLVHASQVLGYSKPSRLIKPGRKHGCLNERNEISLSLDYLFQEIPLEMIGKLGRLPEPMKKSETGNLISRLKKLARLVVIQHYWEGTQNRRHIGRVLKTAPWLTRYSLEEAEEIGLSAEEIELSPPRIKKRPLRVELQGGFVSGLRGNVKQLVDGIKLDGEGNKINEAKEMGGKATRELVCFLSSNRPGLGAAIAGFRSPEKFWIKTQRLGLSLGPAKFGFMAIDPKNVKVTGLGGDNTLVETVQGWAVDHIIQRALETTGNNKAQAARLLGVREGSLDYRIRQLQQRGLWTGA